MQLPETRSTNLGGCRGDIAFPVLIISAKSPLVQIAQHPYLVRLGDEVSGGKPRSSNAELAPTGHSIAGTLALAGVPAGVNGGLNGFVCDLPLTMRFITTGPSPALTAAHPG